MRDWGCDVYVLGILFDSDFDFDSDSGFQRVCVLYVHGSPFSFHWRSSLSAHGRDS